MPTNDIQNEQKSISVEVIDPHGLHLRTAGEVFKTCAASHSKVFVTKAGSTRKANCNSVLELLTLSASVGTTLVFVAEGPDADVVLAAIAGIFSARPQS